MKEVLTKKFWQDVKKTFDEAVEDSPTKSSDSGSKVVPSLPQASPIPEKRPSVTTVDAGACDEGS